MIFLNKIKERKNREKDYKSRILSSIGNFLLEINDSIKIAKSLEERQFPGASDVVNKLTLNGEKVELELLPSIKKLKKHSNIKKITDEVSGIASECNALASRLELNVEIDTDIRKDLENKLISIERLINNALPSAKETIDKINKNNPKEIWRGFDYSKLEARIQDFITKSKFYGKDAVNRLDAAAFDAANVSANDALRSMNNAYILIQSIFDVDKQINLGKDKFTSYMTKLPSIISNTESYINKPNVLESTRAFLDDIKNHYKQLQTEIAKGDKLIDWILVGALINIILESCNSIKKRSDGDMEQHTKKIQEENNTHTD